MSMFEIWHEISAKINFYWSCYTVMNNVAEICMSLQNIHVPAQVVCTTEDQNANYSHMTYHGKSG